MATKTLTPQDISLRLENKLAKAQEDWELFLTFPIAFSSICWASDSNKPVWDCSCAQCKESIKIARNTGKLPHWFAH